jgi:hypothetical protein
MMVHSLLEITLFVAANRAKKDVVATSFGKPGRFLEH